VVNVLPAKLLDVADGEGMNCDLRSIMSMEHEKKERSAGTAVGIWRGCFSSIEIEWALERTGPLALSGV
jgi:hypothetical protein